jgi:hypothetical protein
MSSDWWQDFTNTHTAGETATYDWPRRPETKAKTFVTVPHLEDPDERKLVFKDPGRRPVEMDFGDMEKVGFVEKPRTRNVGRRFKPMEYMRGVIEGNRAGHGITTTLKFAFKSKTHAYQLMVRFSGAGYARWGEAVRLTVESWEFGLDLGK